MTRLVLLTAALVLLLAPAAHAGELIDRAAQALAGDNVYVDPDASPSLTAAEVERLRDRIDTSRAGRVYVAVMPEGIEREAGGDPGAALRDIALQVDQDGTYVLVSGRTLRAGSSVLPAGEAGQLAEDAIAAGGGDLETILLGFVDRVGDARSDEAGSANGDGDGGGSAGGLIVLGLLGAGGAAVYAGRRRRRKAEAAEFEEAKRNARDDLVSLGDGIRALDLDVQMPNADPAARADYEHAVEAYTRAEEAWERARTPDELEPVGAALEEGRWAMASAKARFEGREPPERRPPCFFDPRHGPSSRDVEWAPPYGEPRPVPACEADAQRVERGADPETREIEWAGRRVPYWQAGPAYAPFAGGYFGGFGGGLLPGLLVGSMLGSAMFPPVVYGDHGGFGDEGDGGDFGGGDFGGGGGDFGGGGGDFGGGDF
ncbi:MAG TPA: hypothetical protein VN213_02810 [Solirubrobacteraceae bacterium]|nr:hypothetical protein [Solirubrobacteraceae bacterium]